VLDLVGAPWAHKARGGPQRCEAGEPTEKPTQPAPTEEPVAKNTPKQKADHANKRTKSDDVSATVARQVTAERIAQAITLFGSVIGRHPLRHGRRRFGV